MTDHARDRLKHLLRDYADAATEYDPTPPSPTAGNTILPGRWHYFKELDHWYRQLPQPMRWNLHERYIRPHARHNLKTFTGKHLPPHTERATHHHQVLPRRNKTQVVAAPYAGTTIIAKWHPAVDMRQVELALDWLLERMHGGDTTSINLPPDLRGATPDPTPRKQAIAA